MKTEECLEPAWSESIAVGGQKFVEKVKEELGFKAIGRKINEGQGLQPSMNGRWGLTPIMEITTQ